MGRKNQLGRRCLPIKTTTRIRGDDEDAVIVAFAYSPFAIADVAFGLWRRKRNEQFHRAETPTGKKRQTKTLAGPSDHYYNSHIQFLGVGDVVLGRAAGKRSPKSADADAYQ